MNTPKDLRVADEHLRRHPDWLDSRARPGDDRPVGDLTPNLLDLDRFAVPVERVEKPWGYELVYASSERYLGKVLFIRAGEQLSLQFHRRKDETIYVHSGRIELEVGEPGRTPDVEVVGPGRAFRFSPGVVHRWRRSRTRSCSRSRRPSSTTSCASRTGTGARTRRLSGGP